MLSLLFDIFLSLLCLTVLFYLLKTRNAINILGNSRVELKQMIGDFSSDIRRAEQAVAALKNNGQKNIDMLEEASKKAVNLHDDLEFLVHRGTDIADRLEAVSYESRKKLDSHLLVPKKSKKGMAEMVKTPEKILEELEDLR